MRALVIAALLLAPAHALAQEESGTAPPEVEESPEIARARLLFEEGRMRADEQRWEDALALFRSSLELVERPSTVWNVAGCLVRLGRRVEAIPHLERFLAIGDPVVDASAISEARALLGEARRMIARLDLHVEPADARVDVDGVETEPGALRRLVLDPGVHVVRATAPGRVAVLREIGIEEGEHYREAIELPLRNPPPRVVVEGTRGAELFVDGERRGELPIEIEVSEGEHLLEVRAEGMRPFSREVRAREGRVVEVSATLERVERSFFETEVFWGIVGGVLGAGAVIGVGAGVAEATRPQAGGGSSGVVLIVLGGAM